MFNIPFTRISQMSASTKIFIMHFQILHLILSYELKELQYFSTSFEVIGNKLAQSPNPIFTYFLYLLRVSIGRIYEKFRLFDIS